MLMNGGFPSQRANNARSVSMSWCHDGMSPMLWPIDTTDVGHVSKRIKITTATTAWGIFLYIKMGLVSFFVYLGLMVLLCLHIMLRYPTS